MDLNRSMRCFIIAMAIFLLAPGIGHAQPLDSLAGGQSGTIEFASPTPAGVTVLVKRLYGTARATISGVLVLPPGTTRVPAMVISHGSGGIMAGREHDWAARLNKLGIATFVVDSFTPRGVRNTASDQSQLSTMVNVADSLSALRLLATHPRIDPQRIGVMGFSRGGQVALNTALEPIRKGVIDDGLHFAAHVAFYPPCSSPFRAEATDHAPILILSGGADDYTPAAPCTDYAAWLNAKGSPTKFNVYPGAYHDFDTPNAVRFYKTFQVFKDCRLEVIVETGAARDMDANVWLRSKAELDAYAAKCITRGATTGGNAAALAQSQTDVTAFLTDAFRLGR